MKAPVRVGFQHVRDEVRRRIESRRWPPGGQLPTEEDLAAEFGCARATVNRALRELADQGLVERRRKRGTRVIAEPVKQATFDIALVRRTIEEHGARYRYRLVQSVEQTIPDWLAARLDLPQDARVLHVECMHYGDNRPFQFEERWINIAAVPHIRSADLSVEGPNE